MKIEYGRSLTLQPTENNIILVTNTWLEGYDENDFDSPTLPPGGQLGSSGEASVYNVVDSVEKVDSKQENGEFHEDYDEDYDDENEDVMAMQETLQMSQDTYSE